MFANTKAFSGFAVDDLEAAKPVRGILRRRSHPDHEAPRGRSKAARHRARPVRTTCPSGLITWAPACVCVPSSRLYVP